MEHGLFKPSSFEEGKHGVVGNCNGFTMTERWELETPLFAKAIIGTRPSWVGTRRILDYGCGVGRLAKSVIENGSEDTKVRGVDASFDMMEQAVKYVNKDRFSVSSPQALGENKFDIAYLIYVLQHVPAIEIRDILSRIHSHLTDDGIFVYCSSDYRMAINFDTPGFFDDRFLGVDLQAEVERLFDYKRDLFTQTDYLENPILEKMIKGYDGGLPHPAKVYTKKPLNGKTYFDMLQVDKEISNVNKDVNLQAQTVVLQNGEIYETPEVVLNKDEVPQKLLLLNRLAPGDCLVMTNAIRDLHKFHPGKYVTDVRTPCPEIFENNPYVTKLNYSEVEYNIINKHFSSLPIENMDPIDRTKLMGDIFVVDMHYPIIHTSGIRGQHFSEGHIRWLEEVLNIKIEQTALTPELYLSQTEKDWINPLKVKRDVEEPYWVINAGSKGDFTLKQYPYYQEVIDLLNEELAIVGCQVKFVQIGQRAHNHEPLSGVVDMVGQTNLRELFRLIYHAEGVVTCVSLPMHVAAAFKKPCVVVAGAREGMRWECYPNHQFLYVNGCLPCASYDGCWLSKLEDCNNKISGVPKCMKLIEPRDVVSAVERYYRGGMLQLKESRK